MFTTEVRKNKAMTRESFVSELNVILKEFSNKFGKHIRTHSFTATIITDFLVSTLIKHVKQLIGHI